MGHLSLQDTTKTRSLKNKNKKKPKHYVHKFYTQPVYLDRTLVHVNFSLTNDATHYKTSAYARSPQSPFIYQIFVMFILAIFATYLQYLYDITPNSEINDYFVSNLLRLSNEPLVNISITKHLDLELI